MTDYVKAWQCVGCGSIEAPQTCIGVCEHAKVEFVYAREHEREIGQLRSACEQAQAALERVVRKLAHTTPRDGAWERSYRELQREAREALSALRSPHRDEADVEDAAKT